MGAQHTEPDNLTFLSPTGGGVMKLLFATVSIIVVMSGLGVAYTQSIPDVTPSSLDRSELDADDGKVPSNIDSKLVGIFESATTGAVPQSLSQGTSQQDKIRVILVMVHAGAPIPEGLGIEVETTYEELVQATVPIWNLEIIAADENVKLIKMPSKPIPTLHNAGTTISEGTGVIGSIIANHDGYTGDGIKVAIIDEGFDIYNPEISKSIVDYQSFASAYDISGYDSDHGTAVAEIVVDIAPNAELYLYNVETAIELLNLLDYLIDRGDIDVITMSLGWDNELGPADGTSMLAEKVDEVYDAGILFVVAAGNEAKSHWQGRFSDPDDDDWHNFRGTDETIDIDVGPDTSLWVTLSWWDSPSQDYDLYLYNDSDDVLARSINLQPSFYPYESLVYYSEQQETVYVTIDGVYADKAVDFQLYTADNDLNEYAVIQSSLSIPADAKGALAVGAVNWADDTLEEYSSQGPTLDGRIKPDISAPTRVSTTSYGPEYFFGTSASAPHVAGAAALVMEWYPDATAKQVREFLEENTENYHKKRNTDGTGILDVEWLVDNDPPPSDPPSTVTLNIQAFNDADGDGTRDKVETDMPGIAILTYTPSTKDAEILITGADGTVSKTDLSADSFWVIALPPNGTIVTTDSYDLEDTTYQGVLEIDDPEPGSVHTMSLGIQDDLCVQIPEDNIAFIILECK